MCTCESIFTIYLVNQQTVTTRCKLKVKLCVSIKNNNYLTSPFCVKKALLYLISYTFQINITCNLNLLLNCIAIIVFYHTKTL